MKNIFSILLVFSCCQYVKAAESFFVAIKSFKNEELRTNSRVITLLGTPAKIEQRTGDFFLSREVLLEKSSEGSLDLTLNIQEHLQDASFKISDVSEIRKNQGSKKLSLQSGSDVYSYEVSVEPYFEN